MTWKPIVVGVDASAAAAAAAGFAERLARLARVECQLVHAAGGVWTEPPPAELASLVDELRLASLAVARRDVEAALAGIVSRQALDRMIVQSGRAAPVLREVVSEIGAGLVVLGGKHHSRLARWMGGSTAHNASRTLPVPILVTGERAPASHPRVLVALDLSHAASRTLAAAEGFARLLGGRLRALHVVEPIPARLEMPTPPDFGAFGSLEIEHVERTMWPQLRLPGSETAIGRGLPADAIADEAREWGADLVVVGSHSKRWVDRVLLGSVTEKLLAALPASLLVVPIGPPDASKDIPAGRTRQRQLALA